MRTGIHGAVLTTLLGFIALGAGRTSPDLPGPGVGTAGFRVEPAYPEDEVLVRFDPPVKLDWEKMAPEWTRSVNLKHPAPETLKRLQAAQDMFRNSNVPYDGALTDEVLRWNYHLVSKRGLTELELVSLRGTARFEFRGETGGLTRRTFFGSLSAAAVKSGQTLSAGFVLMTGRESRLEMLELEDPGSKVFASPADNQTVIFTYIDPSLQTRILKGERGPGGRAVKAWLIRGDVLVDDLLFVSWPGDGTCEEYFSLFRISGEITLLGSTGYPCDV